jgi:capsular polysaccharide biosynthesis protein
VGLGPVQTPMYEASTKIVVGQKRGITQDHNYALGLQLLTQTMAEEVDNHRVAEAVLQEEGLRMTLQDLLGLNCSVERGWLQRIHNLCEYNT